MCRYLVGGRPEQERVPGPPRLGDALAHGLGLALGVAGPLQPPQRFECRQLAGGPAAGGSRQGPQHAPPPAAPVLAGDGGAADTGRRHNLQRAGGEGAVGGGGGRRWLAAVRDGGAPGRHELGLAKPGRGRVLGIAAHNQVSRKHLHIGREHGGAAARLGVGGAHGHHVRSRVQARRPAGLRLGERGHERGQQLLLGEKDERVSEPASDTRVSRACAGG